MQDAVTKKRIVLIIISAMLTAMVLASLCACSDGDGGSSGLKKTKAGMSIQVDESTGKMRIQRPEVEGNPMGDPDTWTVFVYLCGSDLESRLLFGGAATSDIREMCSATVSQDVRFVIETGGSDYWHSSKIDSDVIGRYVIEKGKLKAVGEKKRASMGKAATLTEMVRRIMAVDNFGGNNKAEGYTNMVDMGGMISACKGWSDSAKSAGKALDDAVVYKIAGSDHKKASGLAVYYPLMIQDAEEMNVFESVCVSPYYLSFVGRQGYGSVNAGDTEDYAGEEELFEGGFWSWLDSFLFDEETGDYEYDTEEISADWEYFDDHEAGAQSELITFAEAPGMDADGNYSFVLDDSGYENTSDVLALVYQELEDGTLIELGETYDVNVDWDTGYVSDSFDGYWLSLPDGQNLATYIVEVTDKYLVYTSPILLNGEETYLRMRQYFDNGAVKVEGVWDGIDESGASGRDIVRLQKGDEIIPTYYCIDENGEDTGEYEGDPYIVKSKKGKPKISYDYLYIGDYAYSFCITDVYGDDYITDMAEFNIDRKGRISFYEM